jgi:type IV pilus assembly protein PilB
MEKLDKRKNIGELLIEYGKITREDLEEGLRLQKEFNLRVGETLIKLGKITKDDIEWVLSKQLDIPFVIVENINLDPKLISKFSEELLIRNRILPLYETDEEIAIATDEPLNKDVFESMEGFVNKKIKLSSGNGEKIREILTQFFKREGIPALMNSIKGLLGRLTGTSFYRIDFIVSENRCEINVYGFGLLKNIEVLNDSYTREQILESFASIGIGFLYDEYSSNSTFFLSVFPLLNRIENMSFPAVVGTFGLFIPDRVAFSDMNVSNVPFLFRSERPVPGYIFISAKHDASTYEKTAFTVDTAPGDFKNFYIHTPVPEKCASCRGKGCRTCNDLGYVFHKRLDGIYSSEELKNIITQGKTWQR